MKFAIKTVAASVLLMSASAVFAQQGQTVKIAWLDPLSGLMAAVGTNQLKSFQFIAEEFNKKNAAGVKFEIIGIDNKLSPQETTSALRSAMDQGVRYVVQGNGSGPALAIMDALEKHNARNKGKEVVAAFMVGDEDEIVAVASGGTTIRTPVSGIRHIGRDATQRSRPSPQTSIESLISPMHGPNAVPSVLHIFRPATHTPCPSVPGVPV